jgi:hypothetical protein
MESVWIFNGVQSQFPSGVFLSKELAEMWINKYGLTGTLTEYPVGIGMYDHAISKGQFRSTKSEHETALFIGRFSGGGIHHFHYEDGKIG